MKTTDFPYEVLDEKLGSYKNKDDNYNNENNNNNNHNNKVYVTHLKNVNSDKEIYFEYDILNKFYYDYPLVGHIYDHFSTCYKSVKSNRFSKPVIGTIERPIYYVAGKINDKFEPQLKKVDTFAVGRMEQIENGVGKGFEHVKKLPKKNKEDT